MINLLRNLNFVERRLRRNMLQAELQTNRDLMEISAGRIVFLLGHNSIESAKKEARRYKRLCETVNRIRTELRR